MSPQAMSAEKALFELQVEQHHHDETYHREIARLPMHQRLNHMALHFAKYTGKVAALEGSDSPVDIYIDILIISLSTANILNIKLWDILEPDKREFLGLPAFGRSLLIKIPDVTGSNTTLLKHTAIAAGRMAAACEKIDHLEEIPFRVEIRESLVQLFRFGLAVLSSEGVDPEGAVRNRLHGVKQRLTLHGRI